MTVSNSRVWGELLGLRAMASISTYIEFGVKRFCELTAAQVRIAKNDRSELKFNSLGADSNGKS